MKKVLNLLTFMLGVAVLFAVPASAKMSGSVGSGSGGGDNSTLEFTAVATPDYSSFVTNDGEGTFSLPVNYSFYVNTANLDLSLFRLEFDTDIFKSVDLSILSQGDWQVLSDLTNGWEVSITGLNGTRLFEDGQLLISAKVTLSDSMIGSPVAQMWSAKAGGGTTGMCMCPGCCTISWNAPAPVPEPATMLLFGIGLAGLVGSRIRRKKK